MNFAKAQDAYAELDQLQSATETNKPISYEVKYWFYENLVAQIPSDSMVFKIIQQKNAFVMEAGDYMIWQQGDRGLTIDNSDKKIYLQRNAKTNVFDLSKFKDLAENFGLNLNLEKQNDTFNKLTFDAPQASNTKITITYNSSTYRLMNTSLYIDVPSLGEEEFNQTHFEAVYSNYKELDSFPTKLSSFISKRKSTWVGIGKYQNYKVIEIETANG